MQVSRRSLLAAVGGGSAAALAGCLDNGPKVPEDAVESLPSPTLGNEDAPVTIAVFEDYSCPHCKSFNDSTAPKLIKEYVNTGKAKYVFHDYPVLGQQSWRAAMSARSVQDRKGEDAFWTYNKYLFDNQDQLGPELYRAAANKVGADGNGVVEDMNRNKYRPVVQADYDLAKKNGASGTPTVLVNGQKVTPEKSWLRAIAIKVEDELKKQQ